METSDRNSAGRGQIKLMRGMVYEGENYFITDSGGFGGRYIFGTSGVRGIFVKGCEVNGGSQGGKWRNDSFGCGSGRQCGCHDLGNCCYG